MIAYADIEIPPATELKYINDYAGVTDQSSKKYIVSIGKELEDKTEAQAVVVIVNSLGGYSIEDYAFKLFRSWGLGTAKEDNGLLILLSIQDRSWKVEVGTGLEGAITDIYSARVMNDTAVPYLQRGDYSRGISNAYSAYADSIAKEYNITLDKNARIPLDATPNTNNRYARRSNPMGLFILLGLLFADLIFNRGRLFSFLLRLLFWSSFFRGPRGGHRGGGHGGFGGFGGGESGGGGSSGRW
jgi:Beta-propeller domains of methanol dehydrogenase type